MLSGAALTLIIILAVNLLVSLAGFRALRAPAEIEAESGSGDSPGASGWLADPESYLFSPYQVAQGRWSIGVVLSNMAHSGWLHLAFNMFALVSFAGGVFGALGWPRFLLIYAVAGIGCNLVVYLLRKGDPAYRALGASGSVFGIVAAAVVIDPTISIAFIFVPIPIPGPVFLSAYLVISIFLIARNTRDGISHEGHLGGAVAGFLLSGLLLPDGFGTLLAWIRQALGG